MSAAFISNKVAPPVAVVHAPDGSFSVVSPIKDCGSAKSISSVIAPSASIHADQPTAAFGAADDTEIEFAAMLGEF